MLDNPASIKFYLDNIKPVAVFLDQLHMQSLRIEARTQDTDVKLEFDGEFAQEVIDGTVGVVGQEAIAMIQLAAQFKEWLDQDGRRKLVQRLLR